MTVVNFTITKPLEKTFYLRNTNIKSSEITRILGYIDIEATIDNPSDITIKEVRFYIDDELKHTDNSPSWQWKWSACRSKC